MDASVISEMDAEPVAKVTIPFMKFCQKHELVRMLDRADEFKIIFSSKL